MRKLGISLPIVCILTASACPVFGKADEGNAKIVAGVDKTGHPAIYIESDNARGFVIAYDEVSGQPSLRLDVIHAELTFTSVCDGMLYFTPSTVTYVEPGCHQMSFHYPRNQIRSKFHGWSSTGAFSKIYEQLDLYTPERVYRYFIICKDLTGVNPRKIYGERECKSAGNLWEKWATLITVDFSSALDQFAKFVPNVPPATAAQIATRQNANGIGETAAIRSENASPVQTANNAMSEVQSSRLPTLVDNGLSGTPFIRGGKRTLQVGLNAIDEQESDRMGPLRFRVQRVVGARMIYSCDGELSVSKNSVAFTPASSLEHCAGHQEFEFERTKVHTTEPSTGGLLMRGLYSDLEIDGSSGRAYLRVPPGMYRKWIEEAVAEFDATQQRFDDFFRPIEERLAAGKAKIVEGDEAAQRGNLPEALKCYKQAQQGVSQDSAEQTDLLGKISKVSVEMAEQSEGIGDTALKEGKPQEARKDYQAALEMLPVAEPTGLPDNLATRVAELYQILSEKIKNEIFQEALQEEDIGDAAANNGKVDEAIQDYENARSMLPDTMKQSIEEKLTNLILQPATQEEEAGDAAAWGQPREAYEHYTAALHRLSEKSASDLLEELQVKSIELRLRHKGIKVGTECEPPPVVPEEARKHFVIGNTLMRTAKSYGDFESAIAEYRKALSSTLWYPDAYYNLGSALVADKSYDEAEQALKFYLETNPSVRDTREAQDKIYEIEGEKLKAAQSPTPSVAVAQTPEISEEDVREKAVENERAVTEKLSGNWYCQANCNSANVSVTGNSFTARIGASVTFNGCVYSESRQCSQDGIVTLAGTVTGLAASGTAAVPGGHDNKTTCDFPATSNPFSATISADGKSINLTYSLPQWDMHAQSTTSIFGTRVTCSSINQYGSTSTTVVITR